MTLLSPGIRRTGMKNWSKVSLTTCAFSPGLYLNVKQPGSWLGKYNNCQHTLLGLLGFGPLYNNFRGLFFPSLSFHPLFSFQYCFCNLNISIPLE